MGSKKVGSSFGILATLGVAIASCILGACASAGPSLDDESFEDGAYAAESLGTLQQSLRRADGASFDSALAAQHARLVKASGLISDVASGSAPHAAAERPLARRQ